MKWTRRTFSKYCEKMKLLHHSQEVTVDEGVTCSVKSRLVTVTGPRGTLTKSFRHLKVGIYQSNINYPNTINLPLTTPLVAKIFSFSLSKH